MTPLQQKHLKAINKWIVTQSGDEELLNQCTRITIESQIELLKSIKTIGFEEAFVCLEIYNKVQELQTQLKQLEK
jgi:hypothetical protein